LKRFANLYDAIDRTTSTNAKVAAMVGYFKEALPADAAWAVFFLLGRRLKRLVPSRAVGHWALAATGLLGIGYEVLVVRVLSQVAENTVYTFAILLAVMVTRGTLCPPCLLTGSAAIGAPRR